MYAVCVPRNQPQSRAGFKGLSVVPRGVAEGGWADVRKRRATIRCAGMSSGVRMAMGAGSIQHIQWSDRVHPVFPASFHPRGLQSRTIVQLNEKTDCCREWVVAPEIYRRPNRVEQMEIDRIGRVYGCHWCGTKVPGTRRGHFIGDHQVPKSVGKPSRIYPHCWSCSQSQGGLLSKGRF